MLAARWIDALSGAVGQLLAVLVPLLVALTFGLVVARYALGVGSIAAQELVLWLHAVVFMLGAAVCLRHGRHVRVDVLQQRGSPRTRAWIELGGVLLFLLPFGCLLLWLSLDYVAASWAQRESSREPGGLPALYLLKGIIPLAAGLLVLQGVAEALRAVAALRGREDALRNVASQLPLGADVSADLAGEKRSGEERSSGPARGESPL
jgi:TRAP-type mannitol/chloroaromatic compound transport system permease small subunit